MPLLHWLTRDVDIHAATQTPYRLLEEVASIRMVTRIVGICSFRATISMH